MSIWQNNKWYDSIIYMYMYIYICTYDSPFVIGVEWWIRTTMILIHWRNTSKELHKWFFECKNFSRIPIFTDVFIHHKHLLFLGFHLPPSSPSGFHHKIISTSARNDISRHYTELDDHISDHHHHPIIIPSSHAQFGQQHGQQNVWIAACEILHQLMVYAIWLLRCFPESFFQPSFQSYLTGKWGHGFQNHPWNDI